MYRLDVVSTFAFFAFSCSVWTQDILFLSGLIGDEQSQAAGLGYTPDVVTVDRWRTMSQEDFSKYKAIVIGDPYCSGNPDASGVLSSTSSAWAPAVLGNVVLLGTDPSYHLRYVGTAGAGKLMQDSITFAASGTSTAGQSLTGLYVSLSCAGQLDTIPFLSSFGNFTTVYASSNDARVVASGPAIDGLSDSDLRNWGYSVHEAFLSYPTEGRSAFQALAVLADYTGTGVRDFANGISGLPYIIARGATPAGCGNSQWEPFLGEECDDGNLDNGDGCSASCKCESGLPRGDGTCQRGCGDGKFDADLGEECDDGNVIAGDGCSPQCLCELPLLPNGGGKCITNGTVPSTLPGSTSPWSTGPLKTSIPESSKSSYSSTVRTGETTMSTAIATETIPTSVRSTFTRADSKTAMPDIFQTASTSPVRIIKGAATIVHPSNTVPVRRPTAILPITTENANGAVLVRDNSASGNEGSGIILGVNVVVVVDYSIHSYKFGDKYVTMTRTSRPTTITKPIYATPAVNSPCIPCLLSAQGIAINYSPAAETDKVTMTSYICPRCTELGILLPSTAPTVVLVGKSITTIIENYQEAPAYTGQLLGDTVVVTSSVAPPEVSSSPSKYFEITASSSGSSHPIYAPPATESQSSDNDYSEEERPDQEPYYYNDTEEEQPYENAEIINGEENYSIVYDSPPPPVSTGEEEAPSSTPFAYWTPSSTVTNTITLTSPNPTGEYEPENVTSTSILGQVTTISTSINTTTTPAGTVAAAHYFSNTTNTSVNVSSETSSPYSPSTSSMAISTHNSTLTPTTARDASTGTISSSSSTPSASTSYTYQTPYTGAGPSISGPNMPILTSATSILLLLTSMVMGILAFDS